MPDEEDYAGPNRDLDKTIVTLRLDQQMAERYWEVMDRAKTRNPYATRSDILRELFGLSPLLVVTKEDLKYFREG